MLTPTDNISELKLYGVLKNIPFKNTFYADDFVIGPTLAKTLTVPDV